MDERDDAAADRDLERQLIARTRAGDADAFGQLVTRYQSSVYSVCFRFMGEQRDAEDLTQDAFIRAYQRLHLYDDSRPFGPWLRRLAANLCLNALQRRVPVETELDPERLPESDSDPARAIVATETRTELDAAIQTLPSHYRLPLLLRHLHALSYAEIAQALNLPLSDVKSNLFRARKKLLELVKPHDPTD